MGHIPKIYVTLLKSLTTTKPGAICNFIAGMARYKIRDKAEGPLRCLLFNYV